MPDTDRLAPVVLGLGAATGYSGTDLTNPRDAARAGEVPFVPADGQRPPPPALELRIHGVGGAPPTENLESPATVQVSGDATAGFFRAWYPGGSALGRPHREAYSWGGLNTHSRTRALWLLLVGFMLVNVAHWALPARGARWLDAVGRAVLRMLGLTLTLAFFGTTLTVVADLIAWQAAPRGKLPTWTDLYADLGDGPRLAISLLAALAALAFLCWLSVATTRAYEKWTGGGEPHATPAWALTDPLFWRGDRPVTRQRWCHVAAASAEVILFAALPQSSHSGLRTALFSVAGVALTVAVVLIASPWTDRACTVGVREKVADRVSRGFAAATIAVAVGAALARLWWRPHHTVGALPGNEDLTAILIFVELGLVALLFVVVFAQRTWKQPDVMAKGFAAPLLALLGCLVATIFGAAFTLSTANVLGTPAMAMRTGAHPLGKLYVPSTVYAGSLGLVVSLLAGAMFAIGAAGWYFARQRRWARTDADRPADSVLSSYLQPGGPESVKCVARTWAQSGLTDLAPVGLAVVVLPTAAAVVAYGSWLALVHQPGVAWLRVTAAAGAALGVLATGVFLLQLRSALTNASARKRLGFLWDVGTFWPRAAHPLAPPCYAERSIPEVVTRIRRIVGDEVAGPDDPAFAQERAESGDPLAPAEAHCPVLLTGYSQGTPIAVAVVAQLPAAVRDRIALLTLAAPVRRLYGRAFPAYFGPAKLSLLEHRLTSADGTVRWRNLVRRSDYIGGWAREPVPARGAVDVEIYDPPTLWADHDPTPPPIHRHLQFFPDPQTRRFAGDLAATVAELPAAQVAYARTSWTSLPN